ncbi:hypothetical protein [Halobacterium sp. BOL4-2]|uniref:hypothetical protein n=1 Tax=Halobacterium sp. BOL4-2 TaxID=2810537 RepID=UPI00196376CF|nr:hypothetical protein [Halobacterium sp. BOL4-2]QRY26062.1 hypothetical protein JRZ79_11205 [Halobacterium sp. BOL4-2]
MTLKSEVHDDVKSACRSYISSIEQGEDEVPSDTVYPLTGSGLRFREPKEVDRPSLALRRNPGEHYSSEFDSVSQYIADELDFEMVPEVDIDGEGDAHVVNAELSGRIEDSLRDFTGLVMDYAGSFEFTDAAFEAAYDNQFEPDYADRVEYEILVPLKGVRAGSDISLGTSFRFDSQFDGPYHISDIAVTDISDTEWNGIATFDAPFDASNNVQTPEVVQDYSYSKVLRVTIERRRQNIREYILENRGEDPDELRAESVSVLTVDNLSYMIHDHLVRELVDTVERTFHHYKPRCDPGFGTGYILSPSWMSYRDISEDIVDELYVERDAGHGELVLENGQNGFKTFWDKYASYFTDQDTHYDKPLVRFEEMFHKRRNEDAILDCLIALEGTLLRGTQGSSYTFRLGLRGSFLLDGSNQLAWNREKTREFLSGLYAIRGEIVHQDRSLEDAIDEVNNSELENYNASSLAEEARVVFARIILRYIDHDINHGLSIDEVNQHMDQAALNASYSPGP